MRMRNYFVAGALSLSALLAPGCETANATRENFTQVPSSSTAYFQAQKKRMQETPVPVQAIITRSQITSSKLSPAEHASIVKRYEGILPADRFELYLPVRGEDGKLYAEKRILDGANIDGAADELFDIEKLVGPYLQQPGNTHLSLPIGSPDGDLTGVGARNQFSDREGFKGIHRVGKATDMPHVQADVSQGLEGMTEIETSHNSVTLANTDPKLRKKRADFREGVKIVGESAVFAAVLSPPAAIVPPIVHGIYGVVGYAESQLRPKSSGTVLYDKVIAVGSSDPLAEDVAALLRGSHGLGRQLIFIPYADGVGIALANGLDARTIEYTPTGVNFNTGITGGNFGLSLLVDLGTSAAAAAALKGIQESCDHGTQESQQPLDGLGDKGNGPGNKPGGNGGNGGPGPSTPSGGSNSSVGGGSGIGGGSQSSTGGG